MKVKNVFQDISDILDQGWVTRALIGAQFVLAFSMTNWAMAFAGTALAVKADLLHTAAVIGAVAAVPQALLMFATNKYVEFRYRDSTGKTGNA